jgi:hypothetical protein
VALPVALLLLATTSDVVVAASTTQDELTNACATAEINGGTKPTWCSDSATVTTTNSDNPVTGSKGVLTKVTNVIGFIAGVIAVIIIMIAGTRLILSRGDSAKIVTARQSIIYALVGLVVIVIAREIIVFILSRI